MEEALTHNQHFLN